MISGRWELQLRQALVLHTACATRFAPQAALLHEGKETVHVSHDSFADCAHTRPHSAPTRSNLCRPHGFKDSCAKRQGLMVHGVVENLLDGTSAKQQLRQSLLAELQPSPVKQTRSAGLSCFATLLVPPQPGDQAWQPQQNLADNDHVARRPTIPAQTTQHLRRCRQTRQALAARQKQLGSSTRLLGRSLELFGHRLVEETPLAKRSCPQLFPCFPGCLHRALHLGQLLGRMLLVNHKSLLRLLRQKSLSSQALPQLQIGSFSGAQLVPLLDTEATTKVSLLNESARRTLSLHLEAPLQVRCHRGIGVWRRAAILYSSARPLPERIQLCIRTPLCTIPLQTQPQDRRHRTIGFCRRGAIF